MSLRTRLALAALSLAALPLGSCQTAQSLQNRKVLVAVLLQSPTVKNPSTGQDMPGLVTASVFFGERQDDGNLTTPPDQEPPPAGLDGADVTLSWLESGSSQQISIPPVQGQPGKYAADSQKDAGLHYLPQATYAFTVSYGGDTYTGQVEAAQPTKVAEFDNTTPLPKTWMGGPQPYASLPDPTTVTREIDASVPDSDVDVGFYAVYPVSGQDTQLDASKITCKNTPSLDDPVSMLQLVFDPSPWKKRSFALAKTTCFPQAGNFVLGLTSVKKASGSQISPNLFLGSAVMAGSADAGAYLLQ